MKLEFEPPDVERFPALQLGLEAAQPAARPGAVLNAANEAAVSRFWRASCRLQRLCRLAGA